MVRRERERRVGTRVRAGRIDGVRILEEVRRGGRGGGVFGGNAVFGEAGEGTKGSEAGSRTVEVTWPAKPSGLSNFRLDTSSSSHFAYQPRVTFVPLCSILHLSPSLSFTSHPLFFFPG